MIRIYSTKKTLLILLLTIHFSHALIPTWFQLTAPNTGSIAHQHGDSIFYFGQDGTIGPYSFDTVRKTWLIEDRASTDPGVTLLQKPFSIGPRIWMTGGKNVPSALRFTNYHTLTNTWTTGITFTGSPPTLGGHSGHVIGDNLYLYGGNGVGEAGTAGISWATIYKLDTLANTWTTVTATGTVPSARINAFTATVGDKVFTYGGKNAQSGADISDGVFVLNTKTNVYMKPSMSGPGLNSSDSVIASTVQGNQRIVFATKQNNMFNLVVLDVNTNMWSRYTPTNAPSATSSGVLITNSNGQIVFQDNKLKLFVLENWNMFQVGLNALDYNPRPIELTVPTILINNTVYFTESDLAWPALDLTTNQWSFFNFTGAMPTCKTALEHQGKVYCVRVENPQRTWVIDMATRTSTLFNNGPTSNRQKYYDFRNWNTTHAIMAWGEDNTAYGVLTHPFEFMEYTTVKWSPIAFNASQGVDIGVNFPEQFSNDVTTISRGCSIRLGDELLMFPGGSKGDGGGFVPKAQSTVVAFNPNTNLYSKQKLVTSVSRLEPGGCWVSSRPGLKLFLLAGDELVGRGILFSSYTQTTPGVYSYVGNEPKRGRLPLKDIGNYYQSGGYAQHRSAQSLSLPDGRMFWISNKVDFLAQDGPHDDRLNGQKGQVVYLLDDRDTRKTINSNSIDLSAAIDAMNDDDTMIVSPGTYYANNLNFAGKKINVTSAQGSGLTIIDCLGQRGFVFNSGETSTSVLAGFTMRNCYSKQGGGLFLSGSSPKISDMQFENCEAEEGGAVYVGAGATLSLSNVQLKNNKASISGGALACSLSTVSLNTVTFRDNNARDGGAAFMSLCTLATTSVSFDSNQAVGAAGAVYNSRTTWTSTNDQMMNNVAVADGGSVYSLQSTLVMTGTSFTNNTGFNGGVATLKRGNSILTSTTMTDNVARSFGGALYVTEYADVKLRSVGVNGNRATINGGFLHVTAFSNVQVTNSTTINGNHAPVAGGIYVTGSSSVYVHGTSGAAPVVAEFNTATESAGFLYSTGTAHVDILWSTIRHNKAMGLSGGNGGAMNLQHDDTWQAQIRSSTFHNNSVAMTGRGGAVYLAPAMNKLMVMGTTFSANEAQTGGAMYINEPVTGMLTLNSLTLNSNVGRISGGGFFFAKYQPLPMCTSCVNSNNVGRVYGDNNATVPHGLRVVQVPTTVQDRGVALNPILQVAVVDIYNRIIRSDNSTVVDVIAGTGSQVSFVGPTKGVAVNGVASYDGLSLLVTVQGTYALNTSSGNLKFAETSVPIKSCVAGTFRSGTACLECSPGQYSGMADMTACVACPAGQFSAAGASSCQPCAAGRSTNNLEGQAACVDCAAGTFAVSGNASCTSCPLGTFSGAQARNCTPCEGGTYTPNVGQAVCASCGQGQVYKPDVNPTGCIPCPTNAVSPDGVCICDSGFYSLKPDPALECLPCPPGGICSAPGTLVNTIRTSNQFWRANDSSALFVECIDPDSCLGGEKVECREGHTGVLCGECKKGFGKNGAECQVCPSRDENNLALIGIVIAAAVVTIAFVRSALNSDKQEKKQKKAAKNMTTPMLKIFMNYLQLTSLAGKLDLKWPEAIQNMFNSQETVSSVRLQTSSIDCVLVEDGFAHVFYPKFLAYCMLPFGAILVPALFFGIYYLVRKNKTEESPEEFKNKVKTNCVISIMVILFLIHPSVSQRIFEVFSCVQVGEMSVLAADVTIDCNSEEHAGWVGIGVVFLLLWTFGIPISGGVLLWKNRQKVYDGDRDFKLRFGFLFNGYETEGIKFLWEVGPVMFRKVFLTFLLVFLSGYSVMLQTLAGLFLVYTALILHVNYSAYENPGLDKMEFLSLVSSFVTLYFGLFFFVDNTSDAWKMALTVWILVLNIISMILFALLFFHYAGFKGVTRMLETAAEWFGFDLGELVDGVKDAVGDAAGEQLEMAGIDVEGLKESVGMGEEVEEPEEEQEEEETFDIAIDEGARDAVLDTTGAMATIAGHVSESRKEMQEAIDEENEVEKDDKKKKKKKKKKKGKKDKKKKKEGEEGEEEEEDEEEEDEEEEEEEEEEDDEDDEDLGLFGTLKKAKNDIQAVKDVVTEIKEDEKARDEELDADIEEMEKQEAKEREEREAEEAEEREEREAEESKE